MVIALPSLRHLDYGPEATIEDVGLAGLQAILDGGGVEDWRDILRAVRQDPWGSVARRVERLLPYLESYGTAPALAAWLHRCRAGIRGPVRSLAELRQAGRLTQREFAERLGVSQAQVARVEQGANPTLRSLRRYLAGLDLVPVALIAAGHDGPVAIRLPAKPDARC